MPPLTTKSNCRTQVELSLELSLGGDARDNDDPPRVAEQHDAPPTVASAWATEAEAEPPRRARNHPRLAARGGSERARGGGDDGAPRDRGASDQSCGGYSSW